MKYDPQYHNRKSNRLRGYDYAMEGAYFITICTYKRQCMFGHIEKGKMILNEQGIIANEEWLKTFEMRKNTEMDVFIVMPNHIHGIIVVTHHNDACRGVLHTPNDQIVSNSLHTPNDQIQSNSLHTPIDDTKQKETHLNYPGVCNTPLRSPSATIGAMVRGYKSSVTKKINLLNHSNGFALWQRNYHDHIIRDHTSYIKISNYIVRNPETWQDDILFKG